MLYSKDNCEAIRTHCVFVYQIFKVDQRVMENSISVVCMLM